MIDQNLVRLIADAGRVGPGDLVLEVGPGTGTLTEELLARGARVRAVEIDRDLAAALRQRFAGESRFELIEGDALAGKHEVNPELLVRAQKTGTGTVSEHTQIGQTRENGPAPFKLVANLPYSIASPLVINLLIEGIDLLVFTVQKEVADRLRASPGTNDYGPLSVMAQLLGEVEVLRTLAPQAFWPAPKVDSALVRITPRRPTLDARALGRLVQAVFAYRRKTLRKALEQAGLDVSRLLAATGLDCSRRPEVLTPEEFAAIARAAVPPPGSAAHRR